MTKGIQSKNNRGLEAEPPVTDLGGPSSKSQTTFIHKFLFFYEKTVFMVELSLGKFSVGELS